MINFFFYKRIIINIIFNLYKFKYTSINILPYFKVKSNQIVINNKRLFIVSSCLNPNNNINNERLVQTINGLKSIKNFYTDTYLVILENSLINENQELQFREHSDLYLNYSSDPKINQSNKHINKGVPQFYMFLKFLIENQSKINVEFIHFISARYSITKKISEDLIENGSNFRFNPITNNVSTRHFIFRNIKIQNLINLFKNTYILALLGCSVEDTIFLFSKNYNKLRYIFITGYVSGLELINE
jgi:hypothetical protein